MIPLIIATTVKITEAGWQVANCDLCNDLVYDHKENLEKVRSMDGFVICPVCAIVLKLEGAPSLNIEAQMWHGHLREPKLAKGWKPIMDFLNKK